MAGLEKKSSRVAQDPHCCMGCAMRSAPGSGVFDSNSTPPICKERKSRRQWNIDFMALREAPSVRILCSHYLLPIVGPLLSLGSSSLFSIFPCDDHETVARYAACAQDEWLAAHMQKGSTLECRHGRAHHCKLCACLQDEAVH